jgi:HK97 family phage major capsid protein
MNSHERAVLQAKIELVEHQIAAVRDSIKGRPATDQEKKILDEMEGLREDLRKHLPIGPFALLGDRDLLTGRPGPGSPSRPFALRGPRDAKDYDSLFGGGGYQWQDRDATFLAALFSGRHHPGLVKNATMTETVPSDGGFLVPVETARQIHAVSLENELVAPRAYVQPMLSNECKVPAMEIGDHSTALLGGFTASYVDELGTITEANPKARGMTLNAKKLTGLIRVSNELAADAIGGEAQIINLCGKGLAWYRDKAFLKGTGAGQPLGILNAGCLVSVDPESGQDADTIMYENLTKMMAAMFAGSFNNSVWVCHQTTIPQLLTLSIAIGTGGAHIPVMRESDGVFSILTRPVLFTEKTEALGNKGDIMLCDFSQYCVGLRQGMRIDTSIHVGFSTDELYARLIERHDGQPLWDKPLTLLDGATKVSPFVCLAAR